jgi:hypothetical protein
MDHIKLDAEAQRNIQAYIDYNYYAGEDAQPFSPEEYAKLKQRQMTSAKTRVYTVFRNVNGRDCKTIGPATKCFCNHRYKEHNYLDPINKKVVCNVKGCKCQCFDYIPVHGSTDFKCLCKHSYTDHNVMTHKCDRCKGCKKFMSTWSCSCEYKWAEHKTIVGKVVRLKFQIETRQERLAAGKGISENEQILMDPSLHGQVDNHGMNSFQALVDGAERFGAQVEDLEYERNQQLALGYAQPRGMLGGLKGPKGKGPISAPSDNFDKDALDYLNQRMEQEKQYNSMSSHSQPSFPANQVIFPSKNKFCRGISNSRIPEVAVIEISTCMKARASTLTHLVSKWFLSKREAKGRVSRMLSQCKERIIWGTMGSFPRRAGRRPTICIAPRTSM